MGATRRTGISSVNEVAGLEGKVTENNLPLYRKTWSEYWEGGRGWGLERKRGGIRDFEKAQAVAGAEIFDCGIRPLGGVEGSGG